MLWCSILKNLLEETFKTTTHIKEDEDLLIAPIDDNPKKLKAKNKSTHYELWMSIHLPYCAIVARRFYYDLELAEICSKEELYE